MPEDGWSEWGKHVLAEQSRMSQAIVDLGGRMDTRFSTLSQEIAEFKLDMTRDVTTLKTKAGIFGGLAGGLTALVAWLSGRGS